MPLISDSYREMNRQMHADHPTYGITGGRFKIQTERLFKLEEHKSILDYGAGKQILKQLCPELPIACYDPAIPEIAALPEPADLVLCIDVLEHIEPQHLNAVLRHIQSVTKRKALFSIATRPADKTLPDGRNAHLTQRDAMWWRSRLRKHFKIVHFDVMKGGLVAEGLPITGPVLDVENMQSRKRRPVPPGVQAFFQYVREHSARYADDIHRIKTINVFEGSGDKKADSQMLFRFIEDCNDPELVLRMACELARISVMAIMKCAPEDAILWKRMFENRLRVVDWHTAEGLLHVNGSPCIHVQGITAVGAVEDETRWQQVVNAVERFPKRVQTAPAHDKVAVLACYGPSLGDMIPSIKEAQAAGGVVVSVSGSHDFLLNHGIKPVYHIECDPRLHKADNMDRPIEGIQYLIASVVHPGYFDKLEKGGADIRLWHIAAEEHTKRLVDKFGEKGEHMISGGGSVGSRAVPVMYSMGYRNFAVYSMDSSFRVGPGVIERMRELMQDPKGEAEALKLAQESVQQWAGKHAGKKQDLCTVLCGERLFVSSPILLTYATGFFEMIQKMPDVSFRVYGNGLLKAMCEVYAGMVPQLASEREKEAA